VNQKLLQQLKPESVEVEIIRIEEPEEAGIEESELALLCHSGRGIIEEKWRK